MSEPKLGWDTGTVKLKNCPQCGCKTTRDFCTPHCRLIDSDNRIEGVEDENKRMREALARIQSISSNNYDHDALRISKIVNEALKNGTITLRE
jgi:hypothetical protein